MYFWIFQAVTFTSKDSRTCSELSCSRKAVFPASVGLIVKKEWSKSVFWSFGILELYWSPFLWSFQEFCVVGVPHRGYSPPTPYSQPFFFFHSVFWQPLRLDAQGIDPFCNWLFWTWTWICMPNWVGGINAEPMYLNAITPPTRFQINTGLMQNIYRIWESISQTGYLNPI